MSVLHKGKIQDLATNVYNDIFGKEDRLKESFSSLLRDVKNVNKITASSSYILCFILAVRYYVINNSDGRKYISQNRVAVEKMMRKIPSMRISVFGVESPTKMQLYQFFAAYEAVLKLSGLPGLMTKSKLI